MAIKTATVYGRSTMTGSTRGSIEEAIARSLDSLESAAENVKAEVAWDTAEFSVESEMIDATTLADQVTVAIPYRTLIVEATAIRHV